MQQSVDRRLAVPRRLVSPFRDTSLQGGARDFLRHGRNLSGGVIATAVSRARCSVLLLCVDEIDGALICHHVTVLGPDRYRTTV